MKMWPFELMATPTASAIIMSLGIFRKSSTTRKGISGALGTSCAERDVPNRNTTKSAKYFMVHRVPVRFLKVKPGYSLETYGRRALYTHCFIGLSAFLTSP